MTERLMIEASGLTKSYGGNTVLRGVDVRARAGQIVALLGPNGAGKTTTVRILATLSVPDAGRARVAGADVVTERQLVRRRIALTGQYAALDDQQTGRENLRMMARLNGRSRRSSRRRADELLDRFDLQPAADRRLATYSGGMRRRLDLAASLVGEPEVIFLDEPSTGLDPRSRQEVWDVVRELADGGTTVLLTTQYLEEADRLAEHIAVLDSGRVVAEGTAESLKQRVGGHRLDLVAHDADSYAALDAVLGRTVVHREPGTRTIGVPITDDAGEVRDLLDRVDPRRRLIARFQLHTSSLDDVFLTLTGRPPAPAAVPEEAHS